MRANGLLRLEGHLKSEDFFGVEKYPTSKFVITRAIPQDTKGNYKVIGNLTIKESTKEVKFFAHVSEKDGKVTATGKMTIDRSEYNVRYGSGSFFDDLGDKTIYDEFDMDITLVSYEVSSQLVRSKVENCPAENPSGNFCCRNIFYLCMPKNTTFCTIWSDFRVWKGNAFFIDQNILSHASCCLF